MNGQLAHAGPDNTIDTRNAQLQVATTSYGYSTEPVPRYGTVSLIM